MRYEFKSRLPLKTYPGTSITVEAETIPSIGDILIWDQYRKYHVEKITRLMQALAPLGEQKISKEVGILVFAVETG